jgi:hypothetical protein
MVETKGTSGLGRHLFLPPQEKMSGATLFVGFHLFGTSDRIEWSETVVMRLVCHALIQWLPDDALSDVAGSLTWLYDVGVPTPDPHRPAVWSTSPTIGISAMIQKRIDTLANAPSVEEGLSKVRSVRDQLANWLQYADLRLAQLSEHLELADLLVADTEPVVRATGVLSRRVPDDGPLTCDPDE